MQGCGCPGSWGRFQSCVGCCAWGWYVLVLQRNYFKAFPASGREMLCCPGLVGRGARLASAGSAELVPSGTCLLGGREHPGCSRRARGALVQLSVGPKAALAAGDSHEQMQDVCGLTETSRACASRQMDGKDARGWSSSSPGRAVTRTAGSVLGWLEARVGGEGPCPPLGLLLSTCARHGGSGSTGVSMCQDWSGPAWGSTEQLNLCTGPSGSCWPL